MEVIMPARIKKESGRARLYIDGKLTPPIIYGLSDFPAAAANTHYAYTNIKSFGERGINIVTADSSLHLGWHRVSPYDPEAIHAEVESVMDANPEAKVLLRLHINAPYWWMRDYPEECVIYRTPDGDAPGYDDGEQDRLIRTDGKMDIRASFASERWLSEGAEILKKFLLSLEGTRAGEGLVGVQLACGKCGEWHAWGVDVSEPMKRLFVKFLKEKYVTKEALWEAYGDDTLDFDTVPYTPEPYYPLDEGIFRDPKKNIGVIDSQMSNQKATSEAILHFAKVVKETAPDMLCGAFYGYIVATGDNAVIGGHLNISDIYESPYVDYICGPFCYMENRLPTGVPMQRALLESHRLRGMMWLTEMDQYPFGVEVKGGGTPENFAKNLANLRRNTLQPLFGGHGFWFYDHRLVPNHWINVLMGGTTSPEVTSIYRKRGWWDDPKMLGEIEKIKKFGDKFTAEEHKGTADVLLVHSAEAKYYRYIKDFEKVELALFEGIARCGAVYDCIYISELDICEIDRYKCVIFFDCGMISPETRELIKERCKDKICVFLHGAGYCDGSSLGVDNLYETTGMRFGRTEAESISFCGTSVRCELPKCVAPVFSVESPEATALANFEDGKVAAARLGNSVYVSLPYLPREVAKEIFAMAGVHLWFDGGDPVLASGRYVMINCQGAGERRLRLPDGRERVFSAEDFETAVFDTETLERIL